MLSPDSKIKFARDTLLAKGFEKLHPLLLEELYFAGTSVVSLKWIQKSSIRQAIERVCHGIFYWKCCMLKYIFVYKHARACAHGDTE